MKQNIRLSIIILTLASFNCRREPEMVGPAQASIYLEVKNLQVLPQRVENYWAGHYEAWISFTNPAAVKEQKPEDADSSFVSIGKFIVESEGHLLDLDGKPFQPRLAKKRNLQYMVDAIITFEDRGDTDNVPGPTLIGGAFTGDQRVGVANLSTNYRDAFNADFKDAEGYYLLAAPTSLAAQDSTSGVWFMRSLSPETTGFTNLPTLPDDWTYEGFVEWITADVGQEPSTGRFTSASGWDSDSAGIDKGPAGNGYPFPGSDFIGLDFNLRDWAAVRVAIRPRNALTYYYDQLTLFGPTIIPQNHPKGRPIKMQNSAASFPTAKITVIR